MTDVITYPISLLRYYEGPFKFSEATREFHSPQIDLYQGLCEKTRENIQCVTHYNRGYERHNHKILILPLKSFYSIEK